MERLNVLIVEDELDLREALRDDLLELNYEVATASHGREALEYVKQNSVDIVLSDLNMPHLSGSELLMELRDSGWTNPFIVLSGHGSRDEVVRLLRYGA